MAQSESQTRRLTFEYFLAQYKAGWLMIAEEFRAIWLDWRPQHCARKGAPDGNYSIAEEKSKTTLEREEMERADWKSESSTLVYGLGCLAKLFNVMLLYGPGFVFDPRPGLLPSRRFIVSFYATILGGIALGLSVALVVLEPTLMNVMPGLASSISKLLALTTTASEFLMIIYGLGSILFVVHHWQSIREFVLYQCNIICLPRRFQRRKAVELFLSHYILTLTSKPIFISLTLILDPDQPIEFAHLGGALFLLARALSITIVCLGSLLVCTSGMVVPLTSSFLIVCSATHMKQCLEKNLERFRHANELKSSPFAERQAQVPDNSRMAELLDERTRQVIADYSCDTLTADWPQLVMDDDDDDDELGVLYEQDQVSSQQAQQEQCNIKWCFDEACGRSGERQRQPAASVHFQTWNCASPSSERRPASTPNTFGQQQEMLSCSTCLASGCPSQWRLSAALKSTNLRLSHCQDGCAQYHTTANNLLFLYKNLIKSMSELKSMIGTYEKKFGTFHLVQVCIDSLIVAQWITTSLTESRLRESAKIHLSYQLASEMLASGTNNNSNNNNNNISFTTTSANETQIESRPAYLITPFAFEAAIGVISFVISNSYVFLKCHCLPDCMVKMRSKLFKMNIELAQAALRRPQAGRLTRARSIQSPAGQPARSTSSTNLFTPNTPTRLPEPALEPPPPPPLPPQASDRKWTRSASAACALADECAELDQVWALYDQAARLSELANFRLAPGTFYSKRCLLWIFGRTVSLTLFCIQIVDIYSYL